MDGEQVGEFKCSDDYKVIEGGFVVECKNCGEEEEFETLEELLQYLVEHIEGCEFDPEDDIVIAREYGLELEGEDEDEEGEK